MAGGWSRDGAVQDQIDDTIADAVSGARARMPVGEGLEYCESAATTFPTAGARAAGRAYVRDMPGDPRRQRAEQRDQPARQ